MTNHLYRSKADVGGFLFPQGATCMLEM